MQRMDHQHSASGDQRYVDKIKHRPMKRAEREEQEIAHGQDGLPIFVSAIRQPDPVVEVPQSSAKNQCQGDSQPPTAGSPEAEQPGRNADDGSRAERSKEPRITLPDTPQ